VDRKTETPIAVHNALNSALCGSMCLAYHDNTVLNPLTLERPLLELPESTYNAYSVALCSLQCHVSAAGYEEMEPLLKKWNVNITSRFHPFVEELVNGEEDPTSEDLFEFLGIVADNDFHPFLIGNLAIMEIYVQHDLEDGWNRWGWYTYDPLNQTRVECTSNCRAFDDISGYQPRNHPGRPYNAEEKYTVEGLDMYWQPLLEDDGEGYFSRQEHGTYKQSIIIFMTCIYLLVTL
jgi:hypothetical protein